MVHHKLHLEMALREVLRELEILQEKGKVPFLPSVAFASPGTAPISLISLSLGILCPTKLLMSSFPEENILIETLRVIHAEPTSKNKQEPCTNILTDTGGHS